MSSNQGQGVDDLDWECFFARYKAAGRRFAAGLVGDREAARDLYQDAARAVFERERSGENRFESAAHARNYLFRVLRNLAIDTRAARRRRPQPDPTVHDAIDREPGSVAKLALDERDAALRTGIAALRPAELSDTYGVAHNLPTAPGADTRADQP